MYQQNRRISGEVQEEDEGMDWKKEDVGLVKGLLADLRAFREGAKEFEGATDGLSPDEAELLARLEADEQQTVLVYMEGGLISAVEAQTDFDVLVIDYDTEGVEEDDIIDLYGDEASVSRRDVFVGENHAEKVAAVLAKYE